MQIEDKLKDKLLKLNELAKRGIGGEKLNAGAMLMKMLSKHGLSIEDINQEISKKRHYKYSTLQNKTIVIQIMFRVMNESSRSIYSVMHHKEVTAEVTDYEHIQILEMVDFHLDNFKEERKKLLDDLASAYVQKHNLFRETTNEDRKNKKPLTPEERAKLWRVSNIQECLTNKTYIKKLN